MTASRSCFAIADAAAMLRLRESPRPRSAPATSRRHLVAVDQHLCDFTKSGGLRSAARLAAARAAVESRRQDAITVDHRHRTVTTACRCGGPVSAHGRRRGAWRRVSWSHQGLRGAGSRTGRHGRDCHRSGPGAAPGRRRSLARRSRSDRQSGISRSGEPSRIWSVAA